MSFYVSTATFFLLHCDEWDRVVALPRHKFVTGATLLQLYTTLQSKQVLKWSQAISWQIRVWLFQKSIVCIHWQIRVRLFQNSVVRIHWQIRVRLFQENVVHTKLDIYVSITAVLDICILKNTVQLKFITLNA